jgi:hypothetical protein
MTEAETITRDQRARFLEKLADTRNVTIAAQAAGIARRAALSLRARDAGFAAAWQDAEDAASDLLEHEARERAIKGVAEPVYYHGKKVGEMRRYSETLLLMFLRAERPEKFADKPTGRGTAEAAGAAPRGGVLVVPGTADPKAWAKKVRQHQKRLANGGPG